MRFQISDIPRLLPELLLVLLALLVLLSDVLERWKAGNAGHEERASASRQLAATGLGVAFVLTLIQSRLLFAIGAEQQTGPFGFVLAYIQSLQAAGPGGEPILGAFATDMLTVVARLAFIGAAWLTVLLSDGPRTTAHPGEMYALLIFSTVGMCLMAASTDLILAYLALELSSIALYVLAGYFRPGARAAEAGFKYYLFGVLSSGILLYGMSLAYGITANASVSGEPVIGTLMSEVGRATAEGNVSRPLALLAMLFIVAGVGYKVALVPFHSWSPDTYEGAPTVVTAFLASASKVAGFLLLFRLLTTAFPGQAGDLAVQFDGWSALLVLLALATLVVGNLAALPQQNAKRLLAYSGIGHAGFVLLAFVLWGSGTANAAADSADTLVYYLIVYGLTSLGAFGALAAAGAEQIGDLNGLARRNLSLAVLLTVLVLSLAGIPPLAGYWAKFFVFLTGYRAGAVWLVAVAIAMTVVSLYYYLRFLKAIWMTAPATDAPMPALSWPLRAALLVTVAATLVFGLFPGLLYGILTRVPALAAQ